MTLLSPLVILIFLRLNWYRWLCHYRCWIRAHNQKTHSKLSPSSLNDPFILKVLVVSVNYIQRYYYSLHNWNIVVYSFIDCSYIFIRRISLVASRAPILKWRNYVAGNSVNKFKTTLNYVTGIQLTNFKWRRTTLSVANVLIYYIHFVRLFFNLQRHDFSFEKVFIYLPCKRKFREERFDISSEI